MSAETDPVPMSTYPDHITNLMAEVRDLRAVRDAARRLLDRTENNELFAREAEALAEALTRLEAGRG